MMMADPFNTLSVTVGLVEFAYVVLPAYVAVKPLDPSGNDEVTHVATEDKIG
jgi:hypothetical protein